MSRTKIHSQQDNIDERNKATEEIDMAPTVKKGADIEAIKEQVGEGEKGRQQKRRGKKASAHDEPTYQELQQRTLGRSMIRQVRQRRTRLDFKGGLSVHAVYFFGVRMDGE